VQLVMDSVESILICCSLFRESTDEMMVKARPYRSEGIDTSSHVLHLLFQNNVKGYASIAR
jgi:hypothetical protein